MVTAGNVQITVQRFKASKHQLNSLVFFSKLKQSLVDVHSYLDQGNNSKNPLKGSGHYW